MSWRQCVLIGACWNMHFSHIGWLSRITHKPESRTQIEHISIQFLSDPWLLKWKWKRVQLCFTRDLAFQSLVDIYNIKGESTNKNRSKYHICICNPKTLALIKWFIFLGCATGTGVKYECVVQRLTSEVRACLLCDKEHLDNGPGWVLERSNTVTHKDNRSPLNGRDAPLEAFGRGSEKRKPFSYWEYTGLCGLVGQKDQWGRKC